MSFRYTKEQVLGRRKTVTRRLGWTNLKPGTLLRAVDRVRGLKKGEAAVEFGVIRVVSVRRERLDELVNKARPDYGPEEMLLEGFPWMDPQDFMLRFFIEHIDPNQLLTRIEFEYVDGEPS